MNETTNPDQLANAAVPEAPPPDVEITTVATPEALQTWRAGASIGDSGFVYYAGPSMVRIRSRDLVVDRIAATVWSMYEAGRCVPVCSRNGSGWIYSAQAVDNEPVRPKL
jgi:hypothetical protein